jgi:ATP-dependent helicase/nuclease subunit A
MADDPTGVANARTAMLDEIEDEYRRLLYVAMTRAADRLIIGGCMPGNRKNIRPDCWYDLIARGLAISGLQVEEFQAPSGGGVKRYTRPEDAAPSADAAVTAPASHPIALPEWLRTPAVPEQVIDGRLRPSDPGADEGKTFRSGEPMEMRARALQRGVLVHRLLQSLPDVASERRRDLALQYLARNAAGWSDAERETLTGKVLALIADIRFAPVFAPGSRAEVPIVGRLARAGGPPALVSGQIDRLVVTPSEVLIVDYKTNHAPPQTPAEAPQGYIRQLGLYRAVLQKLYPQQPIRAALLWTETPDLMEISTPALDAQLTTVSQRDDRA